MSAAARRRLPILVLPIAVCVGSLFASEAEWRGPSMRALPIHRNVSAQRVAAPLSGAVAIEDVNVIPMTRPGLRPAQTMVVRGDRIVAIGAKEAVAIPADALVVDGRRRYLVPGLIDAHG